MALEWLIRQISQTTTCRFNHNRFYNWMAPSYRFYHRKPGFQRHKSHFSWLFYGWTLIKVGKFPSFTKSSSDILALLSTKHFSHFWNDQTDLQLFSQWDFLWGKSVRFHKCEVIWLHHIYSNRTKKTFELFICSWLAIFGVESLLKGFNLFSAFQVRVNLTLLFRWFYSGF